MSTDFLNRRMDLKHTSLSENYLTMDTSYPVKLAGKVVKIFTASSIFNTNKWILENSDKEIILTVESDNVYDFAGRVIKNSIGEGKAYPENADVFKQNDYVMVIIDFDNKNLHLCSETNFSKFIAGDVGGDGNLMMFTIDGDTQVENFEYPIDTDIFDTAAEFESEPDKYSFVRSDIDKVVYEAPSNKNGKRNMTPVANVNTVNINSLNTSIQNLVFPFINIVNTPSGFENISGILSFKTINGAVNDKFIDEFCFTESEMINLPMWNAEKIGYLKSEYNNIISDKSNYYYVLNCNSQSNIIKTELLDDSMIFTPINISNKKFSTFYIISNNGIYVKDRSVGISAKKLSARNLIGTWWGEDNDIQLGFYSYDYSSYRHINIEGVMSSDSSRIQYPYDLFIEKNRNSSEMKEANICYLNTSEWKNSVYNSNEMIYAKRFVEFFASDNTYCEHIKNRILFLENAPNQYYYIAFRNYDKVTYDKSLKNVIIMYPETFENVLFDKDSEGNFSHNSETLHNFKSFYNSSVTDFDRKKYTTQYDKQYILNDKSEINYMIYNLFDKNTTSGYLGKADINEFRTINISSLGDIRVKFKSSVSMLGNDGSYQYITNDINGNKLMVNIITRVNIVNFNSPYESENKDYNNAQFGIQDILITRKIQYADEYIKFSDGVYKIYPNGFDNTGYTLLIARNRNGVISVESVGSELFKQSSNIGTNVTGMMYMYYVQGDIIKRIKYFYKDNDAGSTSANNYISKYDYFTTVDIADKSKTYTSDMTNNGGHTYMTKAFLNYYMSKNNVNVDEAATQLTKILKSDSYTTFITELITGYKFYPIVVNDTESCNVYYYNADVGSTNTCGLTVNIDCDMYYAASINDSRINNGSGFRLRDLLSDNNYVIYQNHLAPHVSNTTKNGQYVYNIKSYNDYIKSIKVSDVFYTEEFPYLNGVGIRECYYKDKSLYEFYNYILTRNLAIDISDDNSLLTNTAFNTVNKVFFTKDEVKKVSNIKGIYNEEEKEYQTTFVDADSNPVEIESKLSFHNNININMLYGINKSDLVDSNGNDMSEEYTSEDVININKEQTGTKTVYSLAISDGDPNIPVVVSINGTMDDIETDKLTWESLLIALNNNKSVDLLSKPLVQIKTDLNNQIRLAGQNINDTISIDENITDNDANKHDSIYDKAEGDSQETSEFKTQHYKEHNAEFNNKYNLYDFNYGYGFDEKNERKINNRGIIVFVTEGANTIRNTGNDVSMKNPETHTYDFTECNIYPKRMYISKDGLLCTKEYYDRENATSSDSTTTIKELQKQIDELKNKIK